MATVGAVRGFAESKVRPPRGEVRVRRRKRYRTADNGTRNYNDAPELSIVGTADLVTDTAVIDWKTGACVEHPTNSAQIKFLAAVSNKEWGAVVQIRNGAVVSKRAHYTQTQHALVKGQAKHLLQMVQEKTKYNAGEHCKWCPVRHRCPELRGNTGEFDFLE